MICPQTAVGFAVDALLGAFASKRAGEAISRFAASMPDLASGHILEAVLDDSSASLDYSMVVLAKEEPLVGLFQAASVDQAVFGQTAVLVTAIRARQSDVGLIWLEFDSVSNGRFSEPSFFLAPPSMDASANTGAELGALLAEALGSKGSAKGLAAVLNALPDSVFLRQVGMMVGRPGAATPLMRIVLDGVETSAIVALLQQVNWPGDLDRAERLAGFVRRHCVGGGCRVDLDVGANIAPSLGLEMPSRLIGDMKQAVGELVQMGLCNAAKAEKLVRTAERQTLEETGRKPGTRLDFGLNHLKLALGTRSAQPDRAKAYFSLVTTPDFAQAECLR